MSLATAARDEPPRRRCPLCPDAAGVSWHVVAGHVLLRCPACGHGWLRDPPDATALAERYDRHYFFGDPDGYPDYLADERARRANARGHLDALDARHPGRGRLLDVGCAAGFLLDEARRRGWTVAGLERSEAMADHASGVLGLDVRRAACCHARHRGEPFDAVTVVQVLEHLDDPVGCCLDRFAAMLRPGGTFLVETWDADSRTARLLGRRWHQLSPPTVQHWFTVRSLRRALEAHGFRVVAVERPAKPIGVDTALSFVRGRATAPAARVARRLLRAAGAEGLVVPYPMDDVVRVVAERV